MTLFSLLTGFVILNPREVRLLFKIKSFKYKQSRQIQPLRSFTIKSTCTQGSNGADNLYYSQLKEYVNFNKLEVYLVSKPIVKGKHLLPPVQLFEKSEK